MGTTGAEGTLPGSGALYLICVFDGFDPSSGDRVIYAPGYVALSHISAKYETSGRLRAPLVSLFNQNDPIVPIFHKALYQAKVEAAGAEVLLTQLTSSVAFGHCVFAPGEVEGAFAALVNQVAGGTLAVR